LAAIDAARVSDAQCDGGNSFGDMNERRKKIEGLRGKFRLLIFDVTIQKDSHGGAQKEYETKSNAKHGRR
jgi:hypothetical protein